jgi:hypothetical protein
VDDVLSAALQHEFQRFLYCECKADKTLQIHNWFYHLSRVCDHARTAYMTVTDALEASYRERVPPMQSYYRPKTIICQVYLFLRRALGRDMARVITNLAFLPADDEQWLSAGRCVLRRVSCVSHTTMFYSPWAPKWGDELISEIVERVSS